MRKIFVICCLSVGCLNAQTTKNRVVLLEIRSGIDVRMERYVKLGLEHAEKTKADVVLIDMNTYGGGLTEAIDIVEMIQNFKKPVWVFINSNAASAGAFISIACDSIYMAPNATIGAATVVEGGSAQAAPDKYQSYMRSKMRAAAILSHRDPKIAEGMVDERTVIDSVKEAGKVLTFTTSEAIRNHYCEAEATSLEDVLKRNRVENYDLEVYQLSVTDRIIAFFMNPLISGFLILIILAGMYFEFQAPGSLFPIAAAIFALILYLVPYYLNGLAENWEIILLLIGILLLMAEVFVIPGFGVAGIAGITLTITALLLIMVKNDFFNFDAVPMHDIFMAGVAIVGGLAGGVLLLFFGSSRIKNTKAFTRMALMDTQQASHGYSVNTFKNDLVGEKGVAFTVLRPSGKVMIGADVYDAFTRGEFIEQGSSIIVISTEGISLQVRSA